MCTVLLDFFLVILFGNLINLLDFVIFSNLVNYILFLLIVCYFDKQCTISFVRIKLDCLTMYYIMSHESTHFDSSFLRVDSKSGFLTRN